LQFLNAKASEAREHLRIKWLQFLSVKATNAKTTNAKASESSEHLPIKWLQF